MNRILGSTIRVLWLLNPGYRSEHPEGDLLCHGVLLNSKCRLQIQRLSYLSGACALLQAPQVVPAQLGRHCDWRTYSWPHTMLHACLWPASNTAVHRCQQRNSLDILQRLDFVLSRLHFGWKLLFLQGQNDREKVFGQPTLSKKRETDFFGCRRPRFGLIFSRQTMTQQTERMY